MLFYQSAFMTRLFFAIMLTLTAFFSQALDLQPVTQEMKSYFSSQLKRDRIPGGALVIVEGDQVKLPESVWGPQTRENQQGR